MNVKVKFSKDCRLKKSALPPGVKGVRLAGDYYEVSEGTVIDIDAARAKHLLRAGVAVPAGPCHGGVVNLR